MKPSRIFLTPVLALSLIGVSSLALTACDDQGPAEQLGENIDEAVNDTKRAVEDAAD